MAVRERSVTVHIEFIMAVWRTVLSFTSPAPLYTVSDPLASLAYGPRCSFGFGRGGPGL